MRKTFNVTADCRPNLHYMVDLSSRLAQVKGYVDSGAYFAVNRARQYGKTTLLRALKEYLKEQYYVISMDFQIHMSNAKFRSENTFSAAFAKAFVRIVQNLDTVIPAQMEQAAESLRTAAQKNKEDLELVELFQYLSDICKEADKPLLLVIDEVDSAADFKVDMSFSADEIAGMLQDYENEHAAGMDLAQMSALIYEYTSGYPFLVSKLCKRI